MPYIGAGVQRFNTADNLTVSGTSELKNNVTVTGDVTASGTVLPTGDTAAGDAAALGFTSTEGLILTGQGSTSDITLKNDADATVFTVPTGTDDILFPDSAKILMGADSDLQIFHDGNNSVISDQGTGNLKLLATNFSMLDATNSELMMVATPDGSVDLYHNNVKKFETTSTGVDITGVITTDGMTTSADINFGDSNKAIFGAGSDLQIYHDASSNNSIIAESGSGDLRLQADDLYVFNAAGNSVMISALDTGKVGLGFSGSEKLATTSTGVDITGGFTATDGCTITTADNSAQLTLTSTDADGSAGPILVMNRDSGSPADGDVLGQILYKFDNAAAESTEAIRINGILSDKTDGSEDARFEIKQMFGGSMFSFQTMSKDGIIFNQDSADIDFRVESNGNANALFVDAGNDRVGILTNSPTQDFDINGSVQIQGDTIVAGTESSPLKIASGNSGAGLIEINGGGTNRGGTIQFRGGGNSGDLRFLTGTSGVGSEAMRLTSGGNLFINTTSTTPNPGINFGPSGGMAQGNNNGTDGFYFNYITRNGSLIGSITQSGTTGVAFNTSSDHRLKENVTDLTGAITRVKALAPKRFNFIADADTTLDGFLAHEAQAVVPEAVTGTHNEVDEDGNAVMQGIDQSKLVPLLTGALQEAIAKIETLETKVAALENA